MAKCDICGSGCALNRLASLRPEYQSAGVQDVCPSCRRWADQTKSAMLDEIPERMRAAVAAKKGAPQGGFWFRAARGLFGMRAEDTPQ